MGDQILEGMLELNHQPPVHIWLLTLVPPEGNNAMIFRHMTHFQGEKGLSPSFMSLARASLSTVCALLKVPHLDIAALCCRYASGAIAYPMVQGSQMCLGKDLKICLSLV